MTGGLKLLLGTTLLSMMTPLTAAAQSNNYEAEYEAFIQKIQKDDGVNPDPFFDSQYPNYEPSYGQAPYGPNPYAQPLNNQPQSPNDQNPYYNPQMQPAQNANSGYNSSNSMMETPNSIPGSQTIQIMDTQNPQRRPIVAYTRQIPAGVAVVGSN